MTFDEAIDFIKQNTVALSFYCSDVDNTAIELDDLRDILEEAKDYYEPKTND